MIITEIQYFFSKIIRFQAIFKDTVEFTCALEFKISSQRWFKFLFSSIQFHLLNFRSFFTFFGLHIYDFYGIIIQKMIEYSIYYKQVVPPCQEKNVKIRCIFQIEYSQIPLYIVTAR